ncbi:MAG: hypothetical protein ACOX9E_01715 [Lentisphaeria bacterium]|jgi:hypothetical protein
MAHGDCQAGMRDKKAILLAEGRFFYPQIPQIDADDGGLSCCCAAIHAAGFFAVIAHSLITYVFASRSAKYP